MIPVSFTMWISLWTSIQLAEWCQTACKPGSVRIPGCPGMRDDHSSGTRLAARLTRPTRAARAEMPLCLAAPPPLFGLAPGGVYPAAPVARGAVRSCRTVSPLPAGRLAALARAVCFLWHFPWGRPRRPLAGTVFPWSPDFPLTPCGISGRPAVWRDETCATTGRKARSTRRTPRTRRPLSRRKQRFAQRSNFSAALCCAR